MLRAEVQRTLPVSSYFLSGTSEPEGRMEHLPRAPDS